MHVRGEQTVRGVSQPRRMATTAGLLAAVLITACVVPQLLAVIRSSEPSGVSTTAAAQASLSCGAWTAYALAAGMATTAVSSGCGAVLWGAIGVIAGVRTRSWPSPWLAACGLPVVVLAATAGQATLGSVLLTEALATTVPQARQARKQVQGVSQSTYLMMGAGAACWIVYGAGAGDWPLAASSLVKAAVCAYIVVVVRAWRRPWHRRSRPLLQGGSIRVRAKPRGQSVRWDWCHTDGSVAHGRGARPLVGCETLLSSPGAVMTIAKGSR